MVDAVVFVFLEPGELVLAYVHHLEGIWTGVAPCLGSVVVLRGLVKGGSASRGLC